MNKQIVSAIGAVAFIIGGLMARANAIEGVEKLEKMFVKDKTPEIDHEPPTE